MSESQTFAGYATRFRDEAEAATLKNVQDRCLRAEAAWRAMAIRSKKTEASRDARKARTLGEAAPEVFGAVEEAQD